jgi:hypothetical protein
MLTVVVDDLPYPELKVQLVPIDPGVDPCQSQLVISRYTISQWNSRGRWDLHTGAKSY